MNFETQVFKKFNEHWGLITVGNIDKFNCMPINLGEFGTLWGKSVVTIYIKPSCYTHELLDQEEYFTLCFLPTWYYSALNILGSTSGRDTDKIKKSGLKPIELPNGVSYSVAEETFIYFNNIPEDIIKNYYNGEPPHDMYIGEIIERRYRFKDSFKMVFKDGIGNASNSSRWTVCHNEETDKYTAELKFFGAGGSAYNLYEINKEIYDKVGTFKNDDYISERLIKTGRHLYESVNDRCGPPYSYALDDNYKELCPWTYIVKSEMKEEK